jgi:hypothetical protein
VIVEEVTLTFGYVEASAVPEPAAAAVPQVESMSAPAPLDPAITA